MALSYRMILFIMLLIFFTILVAFPQFGDCRALQEDEWLREYNGLLLQSLPRGPVKPSSPDPIRP
ncbi:hypothetical protein GYH30_007393 [Glycine max]|nr:hypothetical protein GYH30_007393 [Glycine max]